MKTTKMRLLSQIWDLPSLNIKTKIIIRENTITKIWTIPYPIHNVDVQ